jgi:heat shock protein HslJ
MNDTTPQSVLSPRARARKLAVLALALSALAVTVACKPPVKPPPSSITTTSVFGPPRTCQTIDFDKATVTQRPSTATVPRYLLTVTGTKPSETQTVTLEPVTYVQQPDYWLIVVKACNTTHTLLPGPAPYTATLDLWGIVGTQGIQVAGATRSERIEVRANPGSPRLHGSWYLDPTSLGVPLPAGNPITAQFNGGQISGRAACNTYRASYTERADGVTFGPIATTRMACQGPVGTAETAYLRKLAAVTSFEVTTTRLTLTGPDGTLRYRSALP